MICGDVVEVPKAQDDKTGYALRLFSVADGRLNFSVVSESFLAK